MTTCARCGQEIHEPIRPWDTPAFKSNWVNRFGFPWCPDKSAGLTPHAPQGLIMEAKSRRTT